MAYFVGIDLGTTNIKAVVYDADSGKLVDIASRATPTNHPKPGWSEHDPEEMWGAVAFCLRAVIKGRHIGGVGISSMAEVGVAMDGEMNPLYPMIAWFDRRTQAQAAWWEAQLSLDEMHAISGQRVSTSFGVTKWMWIRDNLPDAAARLRKWLSLPDYILWRLTGELATDYTIASRTLLFAQDSRDWSERMLELAGMKRDQLPPVFPGGTTVGGVTETAHEVTGLPLENAMCVGWTGSFVRRFRGRFVSAGNGHRFEWDRTGGFDAAAGVYNQPENGGANLCLLWVMCCQVSTHLRVG